MLDSLVCVRGSTKFSRVSFYIYTYMEAIVLSREAFIGSFESEICKYGFVREQEHFYRDVVVEQPGSQLIINGQVMNQRGSQIPLRLEVELFGAGAVCHEDRGEEPFELLMFAVHEPARSQRAYINIYYDELERLEDMLRSYFGELI